MELIHTRHPLIEHKLSVLRDKNTPPTVFRHLVDELVTLLGYEVTREVSIERIEIETPVTKTEGWALAEPRPLVVPVLRAGLGMLEAMLRLLPSAEVGFLGMVRDDETLAIDTYAERLPDDISGRQCFLLDPMLATGSTLIEAIEYLLARGAKDVTCVSLVAAEPGLATVAKAVGDRADVRVVVAAVDKELNESNYIVPGLGDAGDRMYGVVN